MLVKRKSKIPVINCNDNVKIAKQIVPLFNSDTTTSL